MLRWGLLAWLVLIGCKSDHSIGCGRAADLGPDDYGPQPGFAPVANAPAGIEDVIVDKAGRAIVSTAGGLARHDGAGAWTAGPALGGARFLIAEDAFTDQPHIHAVAADGTIHRLAEDTFTWTALGNPPAAHVIGLDAFSRFFAEDPSTHELSTWQAGEAAWSPIVGSALGAASVEAAVTHLGVVFRVTPDGALHRTETTTTAPVASGDASTLADHPTHLVTDNEGNLFFATCASDAILGAFYRVAHDRPAWVQMRPAFPTYTTCNRLQWMTDNTLIVVSSDPTSDSVNDTSFGYMPVGDGSSTRLIEYIDGNYSYVAHDRTKFYGYSPAGAEPTFLESTFQHGQL